MRREALFRSFCLSLSLHLLVLLGFQLALPFLDDRTVELAIAPLTVELRVASGEAATDEPPSAPAASPLPSLPKRVIARPPAAPRPVLDGVRLATAADVRERLERELRSVWVETSAEPAVVAAPPPVAAPETAATSEGGDSFAGGRAGALGGPGGNGLRSALHRGPFAPDTPGWYGRIFGQVSVRAVSAGDAFYGRIHLFREDDVFRDYSGRSLFGHSFRHELGGGAVRDFQTGRVQTHGAYLVVTDLFPNGRISTMSHTVLLGFPREAPAGGNLYDVVEEPSGAFRLRGPAGSWLLFDARDGVLLRTSGFVVHPQGETGTPPAVAFRGLHVRIHSVGGNPFLRGRAATVVDGRGAECALSTSDLFGYEERRRESDMFRFPTDREFFAFLAERCAWLALPKPAEPRLITAKAGSKPTTGAPEGGGLIPTLLGGFR